MAEPSTYAEPSPLPRRRSSDSSSPGHPGGDDNSDPFIFILIQLIKEFILRVEKDDFAETESFHHALGILRIVSVEPVEVALKTEESSSDVYAWFESNGSPAVEDRKRIVNAGVDVLFTRGLRVAGRTYDPMTGRLWDVPEDI